MNDYRPLTRKEQLEWQLKYIKEQLLLLKEEQKKIEEEYRLVLKGGDKND